MSLYNVDGQINYTSVSGSSFTGLYAADGSMNIVINDGSTPKGHYHPCGAINAVVVTTPNAPAYANNGSINVIANNFGSYSPPNSGGNLGGPQYTSGLTKANTANVRAAWAAQSGNVPIAANGDSTFAGVTTGDGTAQALHSWPAQLPALLQNVGIKAGANNRYGTASGTFSFLTGFDSRISSTGAWTQGATLAVGGNAFACAATGSMTFTPQGNVTKFVIKWRDGAAGRNFSWQVDGGSATTINSSGTTQVVNTTVSAGTAGIHALTLTWVLGSITILGIDAYDDTAGRVEASIWNWGISGATSANLIDNTDTQTGRFFEIGFFAPKLSLIEGGAINDWRNSISVSTFQTNFTTLVQKSLTVGDVIVCIPPHDGGSAGFTSNQQAYVDAMYTVAAANNCGVFDIRKRWVSYANAVANGWQTNGDFVHPTAAGYLDYAQAILPTIRYALNP